MQFIFYCYYIGKGNMNLLTTYWALLPGTFVCVCVCVLKNIFMSFRIWLCVLVLSTKAFRFVFLQPIIYDVEMGSFFYNQIQSSCSGTWTMIGFFSSAPSSLLGKHCHQNSVFGTIIMPKLIFSPCLLYGQISDV